MFDDLERLANHVSDTDLEWWPFLFLRPEPCERMTSGRVAVRAALYGVFAGLLVNIVLRLTGEHRGMSPLAFPVATTLALFAVFRLTFAACWNRRAARISRGERP
jgi:hypothetical protein